MRFEPAGMTDDPDLRIASSLVDYIFRRLAVDYLSTEERQELGIQTVDERTQPVLFPSDSGAADYVHVEETKSREDRTSELNLISSAASKDAPYCYQCGNSMQRAGSCYVCSSCGTTSGCS